MDYIFTIAGGHIAERGTYDELMQKDGEFSKFYKEFGSKEEKEEEEEVEEEEEAIENIGKEESLKMISKRRLLRALH